MNEKDETLRREVAENLRFAEQVGRKVTRIRDLFEERLKENLLCNIEGEFEFVALPQKGQYLPSAPEVCRGRYNLYLFTEGTSLPNSRLEIFGTIGGHEAFDYVLPPVANITNRNREQLEILQAKVDYLESLLKLIGLLPEDLC